MEVGRKGEVGRGMGEREGERERESGRESWWEKEGVLAEVLALCGLWGWMKEGRSGGMDEGMVGTWVFIQDSEEKGRKEGRKEGWGVMMIRQ